MTKRKLYRTHLIAALAALALGSLGTSALAQRDPAYAAARAAGQIGEQTDGYLGIVGTATPDLRRLVADINIKRKDYYTERAQANNSTVEAYAISAACQAIKNTVPGEKYQGRDGSWKTRTTAPPELDPRCPA